jgi:hypothetical protein
MFCKNCGTNIPDGGNFCPNCGTPAAGQGAAPAGAGSTRAASSASAGISPTAVLWMGIGSLILGIVGALLFGTVVALIGLALGIVGLIFSIKIRKESNNQDGTAAFVLSLLGVIFAALFAIACTACSSCTCGYGKWGCIGSKCMVKNDVDNATEELVNGLNEFNENFDAEEFADQLNKALQENQ